MKRVFSTGLHHVIVTMTCILMFGPMIGCGEEKTEETTPGGAGPTVDVSDFESYVIPFTATVNDEPIQCGQTYPDVGLSKSEIELRDFRVFIHDLELMDADGNVTPLLIEADGVHQLPYEKADGSQGGLVLLDFTDTSSDFCADRGTAEVHTGVVGRAPKGEYTRLGFTIGVPTELNHVNASVSEAPLNVYGMQWTWQSGYRHAKIDFTARTPEVMGQCSDDSQTPCAEDGDCGEAATCDGYRAQKFKPKYYFHPGSQGCESDNGEISGVFDCENPMTSRVELDFAPGSYAIQADLSRFLAQVDLYLGRGCMFASTMADIGGDGFGVPSPTGCPEMYASVGIKLPEHPASTDEELGQCSDDSDKDCQADSDCGDEGVCEGYAPAMDAQPAEAIAQTLFATIDYGGEGTSVSYPEVDELLNDDPFGWPHKDFERDAGLDVSVASKDGETTSHPMGDKRYGATCTKCHQAHGPGIGQFVVSGTIRADDDEAYTAGGTVQMGTGVGNRFGPKTHPIEDKIFNWNKLFDLEIDGNGNFFATADQVTGIDYSQENYFVKIYGNQGICKTAATGVAVDGADPGTVTCDTDADCDGLTYDIEGSCMDAEGAPMMKFGKPLACNEAVDCDGEGATCVGASTGNVPVCDKLLNAMAIAAPGSCNHCHKQGFRIYDSPSH
ncbi:MAG: MbnP family copper-binding protein [Myxococcota bacterium]|nr:MbnP family copper-binding protein [Myxococcota bacterium]